jgi:hypothetical protein
MPLPKRIPNAIWHPYLNWPTGPFTDNEHLKVVDHMTQGGDGVLGWYNTSGGIPHGTIMTNGEIRQHYELDQYSRALRNLRGGVQTNLDGAIQFEIVGYSGQEVTPAQRHTLTRLTAWLVDGGIRPIWPMGRPSGSSDKRASFNTWDNGYGFWGHSQVPENDHTDPNFTDMTWNAIQAGMNGSLVHTPTSEWRKLFNNANASEFNSIVQLVQETLVARGYFEVPTHGLLNKKTIDAVVEWKVTVDRGGIGTHLSTGAWAQLFSREVPDATDGCASKDAAIQAAISILSDA